MGAVWVTGRLLVHGYTAWTVLFRMEGFHRMRATESFQKKREGRRCAGSQPSFHAMPAKNEYRLGVLLYDPNASF
jgi:hypothetical protein